MKAVIDKILGFAISKKLTVFAICVILMFQEKITGEQFINMSMVYIGVQGAIDLLIQLRTNGKK